ncbi:NUMOD4 domain-containing protein [Rossellomorea vietnamensis]|uniref:NUMOD4 domain-containing protein n=1 Tax=Rossellomorea vietnamensis TaxID=218284 RepID=A0ACD4C6Y1_9BACI|nr:NUMOD4 domain-containing protein [Rossellomorea vietnamensis]UXH44429.1 NUMOD4 domain-containing protein [Rossellomorea vietnamensis]
MRKEIYKPIIGYEGLYDISETGKVYSHRSKRTLKRCGDEYGFHIVKLNKGGDASNHNVFELWKVAFPVVNDTEFKGTKKIIYR